MPRTKLTDPLPLACCGFLFAAATALTAPALTAAEAVDFRKQVLPLLQRNCFRCHAGENVEAGLSLNHIAALVGPDAERDDLIVPGDPDASLLIHRITDSSFGEVMPPDARALTDREVNVFRRWIATGAAVPKDAPTAKHWAYQPPQRPEIPAGIDNATTVSGQTFVRSPIDALVAAQLRQAGLQPSDRAAPATLARRASLALTGLPATLEQIKRLEADPSPEAYAAFVDELLQAETFGQHWARSWLDLARYADSNGFQADQLRDAWAYRDWVVDALNQDMPFDQFVIDQIAGDLRPDADLDAHIATGFHRTPTCNVEAGVHPEANRVQQVFDRVNTTATVFLGTTLECAQCHDHKYDPFTQEDYYRLFAYFNQTPLEVKNTSGVTWDFYGPTVDLPLGPEQKQQREELAKKIRLLTGERQEILDTAFATWIQEKRTALQKGRPEWHAVAPEVATNTQEAFEVLPDHSVLFRGPLPKRALHTLTFAGFKGVLSGLRIDALRHDSLPGGGPGRGDAERTNFVLHEIEVAHRAHPRRAAESITLAQPRASFSQQRYDVAGAIDGKAGTAWAVAPQFNKSHWAEFATVQHPRLAAEDQIVVRLKQNYGAGRLIGRVRISLRLGPAELGMLADDVLDVLEQTRSENEWSKQQRQVLRDAFQQTHPRLKALEQQIARLEKQRAAIQPATTLVMVEQDEPRETFVMQRGDYASPGAAVDPGVPATLHAIDPAWPPNRLGLAYWIVDPDNPLLARVTVNRFWMQLFGRGLVTTPEDFGTQADSPSHPELLDWLAVAFIERGWSVKNLLKEIVTSATFCQRSRFRDDLSELDPENRLLARGPRFRLPAETIRDNALAIAGLLSKRSGGPPIMPFQPKGIWRAVGRNQPKWQAATDADRYRRGLYVVWKRGAPYPSFVAFDAPDRASCTVARPRTNTPLQALVLLNDPAYAEVSVAFAQRLLRAHRHASDAEKIRTAYRLATARPATPQAVGILQQLLEAEREVCRDDDATAKRLSVLPKAFRDPHLSAKEVAAWAALTSTLLNLDQTISLN